MAAKKIKILYIIDYFHRTGGTEKHLAELICHLPQERFENTVVVFDLGENTLIDAMRATGASVIHMPVGRVYTPNAFLRVVELRQIIREKSIDIVQTFAQKADSYGAIAAKLSGVKRIVSSKRDTGEFRDSRYLFLNRLLGPLFDRVTVVSDAVANTAIEKEGFKREKIIKIYNGVDTVKFAPPTIEEAILERHHWGFTAADFVVGIVAGFRPEKNYDIFFSAVKRALSEICSLKIFAVGGGPLLNYYRNYCANEGLSDRVVFAGDVANVAGCLKTMDMACLISRSEGFSNAVVEKMAVGLPLVVTGVGGNKEAVVDGDNGIIIPPGDSDAVYESIVTLYADPAMRRHMGRRSREIVEEKFSVKQMIRAYEQLYGELCS